MLIFKRPSHMEFRQVKRLLNKFELPNKDIDPTQFTILKNDDKLLAFGRVRTEGNYTELDCVGVAETVRGKGWGKMIVDKLLQDGPQTIWLTTDTPKYFEKFNFVLSKQLPKNLTKRVENSAAEFNSRLKGMVYSKKK